VTVQWATLPQRPQPAGTARSRSNKHKGPVSEEPADFGHAVSTGSKTSDTRHTQWELDSERSINLAPWADPAAICVPNRGPARTT
jgi:hypothetical protein